LKLLLDGAIVSAWTPEYEVLSYSEFHEAWEIRWDAASVADRGIIGDWPQHRMTESSEHQAMVAKCEVSCALDIVSKAAPLPQVRIETKPRRRVVADVNYGVGELLIVPNSAYTWIGKITSLTPEERRYRVRTENWTPDGRSVWILPHPLVVPAVGGSNAKPGSVEAFWCVHRRTEEELPPGDERKDNVRLNPVGVFGDIAVRPQNGAGAELFKERRPFFATSVPVLVNFKERRAN